MLATQQDDRASLDELIRAHEGYLQQVHLQRARLGAQAPPHLETEIARVEAELAQLRQAAAVKISSELVEELGPTGRYQLWMSHIMRLDTDIGRLRRDIEAIDAKLDQVLIALAVKRAPRRRSSSQRKAAA
jgi:phage shock protein A